jgi:hypothetical protein
MLKRKDGRVDTIIAQSVAEYRPHKIYYRGRKQYNQTVYYAEDFVVLDTETSHSGEDAGWIYQWAVYAFGDYIYGRRPSELVELFRTWRDFYHLGKSRRILVYIHNLSYDIQYLKHYCRAYDPDTRFFCVDSHTMLIVDMEGIRLCCSYKLTNLSLAKLSADYAKVYEKASGEIDYNIIRYQDQQLTSKDWLYMFSDVASQYDGVREYLTAMGYKFACDAPYTSTGFARNSSRHASEAAYWHEKFLEGALSLLYYNLAHQCFIGGQTITSYVYAGTIVSGVGHCDFTSSYPARQMLDQFPDGKPFELGAPDNLEELLQVNSMLCTMGVYRFYGLTIKPGVTAPYIPGSKAIYVYNDLRLNGKIIAADELSIALTELDFKWIRRQYTWSRLEVGNMIGFQRKALPAWFKQEVMKWYRNKCTLKKADPTLYMASKALLNSLYGMSATAIVRDQYKTDDDLVIVPDHDKTDEKQIEDFYKSRKSFMPYQWGVYTTAYARDALHTLIEKIGYENFLYCDTDSVFYRDCPEARQAIEEYNAGIRKRSIAAGAYVDDDNILGIATDEGHIKRFKALHAKCYAYEDDQDRLHVTIAGVPKKSIKWIDGMPVEKTNAQELGSLENLEDGFTFKHNGGSRVIYLEDEPRIETINGHFTELASAAIIQDIEKTISDTMYTVGENYELLHVDFVQTAE